MSIMSPDYQDISYQRHKLQAKKQTQKTILKGVKSVDKQHAAQLPHCAYNKMDKIERIIAIPDLERKIEEALFDAVNHFDKRCPYCQTNLYDGNIRNKIETDHYIPIDLGGQHVPWNVLPSCKKCNRKKKNILPSNFLNIQVQEKCEAFLENIKAKLADGIQMDIDAAQQTKIYIKDKLQRVSSYEAKNILVELSKIFHMNVEVACTELSFPSGEHSIRKFIESECDLGVDYSISKNHIYQKYKEYCSASNMHVQAKAQFFKGLFSLTQGISSFRPRMNGNRENWIKGITIKR